MTSDGDPITRLARPAILHMAPYSSARTEGRQTDIEVYLDANESPYPPYPADGTTDGFNRYPDMQPAPLVAACAAHFDVPADRLFLTRGADEGIDLLVRVFCREGADAVVLTPPTFPMYTQSAHTQGAQIIEVPLTVPDFQVDATGILAAHDANPQTKLVFICSPNNPTGNLARREDVLALTGALLGKAMVVVDELYLEYSGAPSLATEIAAHPNLVVLRSLSKDYSLAGERLGITIADPRVIDLLKRISAPYPIPQSVIRSVTAVLTAEGVAYAQANIARILEERDRVATALISLPSVRHVFPSDANFLLVQVTDADGLVAAMEGAGIKIRNRSTLPGAEGSVRISIGTPAENDRMLAVVEAFGR